MMDAKQRPLGSPRRPLALYLSLPVLSWALYDFANTIFSSNINTIFFPYYMNQVVGTSESMKQVAMTLNSYANALASFFLVLFSPLFGVWVDRTGRKKRFIVWFASISIAATFAMGLFATMNSGREWFGLPMPFVLTVLAFIVAKFFYNSSLVFYDAMLPDLGKGKEISLISGFGVAVGYLGTLLGLTVIVFTKGGHNEHAFMPTAVLYLLFSLPLFFFVRDTPLAGAAQRGMGSMAEGYRDIARTIRDMKEHREVFKFMIAYFFLNDAIATTIATMTMYATIVMGFTGSQFIALYLVSTIFSVVGSFAFGYIGRRFGAKNGVTAVAVLMIASLLLAVFAQQQALFWVVGAAFGVSLGAMWVTSRTLIIELTPEGKRGQFFGLFAFSGKVSAIIGPALFGTVTFLLRDYGALASRIALASLIVMSLIGLFLHLRVRPQAVEEVVG